MNATKTEPIPVHVVNHPKPKRYLERGAYRTAVLTVTNPYQQIAGPDPLRKWITAGPSIPAPNVATLSASGTATSPVAGQTIAQVQLPVGSYTVQWTVQLSGTITATELNNFQLFQSGTGSNFVVTGSLNTAAAGTYVQITQTVTSTNANNFIKILVINLATVGAIYAGQLTVTPVSTSGAFVIAGSISQASDANNQANPVTQPNGRYVPAGPMEIKIEGQQEVWFVASVFPTVIGYTIVREVPE